MLLGDMPEASGAIWQSLPVLYWMVDLLNLKPALVLAEHVTRTGPDGKHLPLVVLQYVGAGKVLFHATDETYRWSRAGGDLYFARYWIPDDPLPEPRKLAEGDRSARLTSDRGEYRAGDAVRLRVRFADERLAPPEDNGVSIVLEQRGRRSEHELSRVDTGRESSKPRSAGWPPAPITPGWPCRP